ncbi:cell division protein FtsQ/DivIB [Nocardioides marmoribigeumensis]|uniref:Cell division protein FtsQ n=1 Tax=Nocardioides marmoribigeumensis TaxID=433649 RepID=A0ABU2BV91_9ACTN|nr:FtsQ-type POTRA domain-containing protein [Nocardioides marmoribigeumensis]MDR7361279.1 cell division protein FtsQ [Nocardioides marmoribigeumensis]
MTDLLHRHDPTEARAEDRFARIRRARRWRALRRVLLALVVLGTAGALVWLVFFSSVLAVKGIRVDGVSVLTTRQVAAAAKVPTGVPLATVDLDAIEARVEDLAPVLDADVSRSWPDKVLVRVIERTAVLVVDKEGTWKGVDSEGVVFRDFRRQPPGLPVVEMQADTSSAALAEAASVVNALPADILRRTTSLDVRSIDSIVLHLRNGARVSWGSADQSGDKARVLAVLLRQKGSTYDVTAPGRPTIRP